METLPIVGRRWTILSSSVGFVMLHVHVLGTLRLNLPNLLRCTYIALPFSQYRSAETYVFLQEIDLLYSQLQSYAKEIEDRAIIL